MALLNAGDALTLRFPADALPPVPRGMTRSFFFYSVGWDKDGDHNVVDGDKVLPLPVTDDFNPEVDTDHWRLRYNTRWIPRDRWQPTE